MYTKAALPLVLLLVSACAQLAPAPIESALDDRATAAASQMAAAPAPARAPVATPHLQVDEELSAEHLKAAAEAAAQARSLWPRITRGFALPPMDNELVREWENWYSSRPDYVARMIGRSSHFLFHIVEQVEKHGMPMEIALLPMIESAYNPVAYSKSHASGIWQFIPTTGKHYGLRQNWWYDGRRDVIAATDAALDYLDKLHGMFGDWQLALASYNWGEGAVGRAMERNRAKGLPTDYESLTVPPETRHYIPKLIAVKNIISNPAKYGLQIADIPNEPFFDTVTLTRHIDMKVAAKLAGMTVEEFKFLNPGHNKPVIKAGEAERIVLPAHKVATFHANLESYASRLVSWQTVTLRRGEKAEAVAAEHGMSLAELKQVNGLQSQKTIVAGQPLLVPLKEGAAEPDFPDLPVTPVTLPAAIKAAKAAAQSKRYVKASGAKFAGRKAVQKASAAKAKPPVKQVRAAKPKVVKAVVVSKAGTVKKTAAKSKKP